MKRIYILFVILCCALVSCTTTQMVAISGTPGTVIYSPTKQRLTTIGNDGKAYVNLSSEEYYAYLFSREQDSDKYVPFAIDYKFKSSAGTEALMYTGMTLGIAGLVPEIGGLAAIIAGAEDIGATMYLVGAGLNLSGFALGMPLDFRLSQTQYAYQYEYLPVTSINHDIKFEKIVDNGVQKKSVASENKSNDTNTSSTHTTSKKTESTQPKNSSTSSRTLNNHAKAVAGIYVGNGLLRKGSEIVERYDRIEVTINRIDNTSIEVDVIECGESYFNDKAVYSVKKGNIGYEMSLKDIPSASISANIDGVIKYTHPRVDIDGDIYTLEITANKQ